MGFPIVNGEKTREPAPGDMQFVTFTGASVVTAVIASKDGSMEVRLVEADKTGKAPTTPEELYGLTPRVILKFPTLEAFEKFLGTLQGSLTHTHAELAALAHAEKNQPPGTTQRKLEGPGRLRPAPATQPPGETL